MTVAVGAPALDVDLYAAAALVDSRALFARVREAGPVVWLPRHRLYAMGRYDDVRAALRDDATFVSRRGVAANVVTNIGGRGTTLFSDGETHDARRAILRRSLSPQALTDAQAHVDRRAEQVVEALVRRGGEFDAVADFSRDLPVNIVADLVGVRAGAERMLRWAAGTFDSLGPLNRRTVTSAPRSLGLLAYSLRLSPRHVAPGTWAASVFAASERGEITAREARALIIDFVAPSLDTTILASTHLLWELAHNPEAYDLVRADPDLIPAAVVENVRLASPIRGFTRWVARDTEVDGVPVPAGARVVLLFGAANLDETRFPDPERFDLHRKANAHLGWGNGTHTCVGIHLAKLEMQALLRAMVPRVRAVGVRAPRRLRNNTLQGFRALTARFD